MAALGRVVWRSNTTDEPVSGIRAEHWHLHDLTHLQQVLTCSVHDTAIRVTRRHDRDVSTRGHERAERRRHALRVPCQRPSDSERPRAPAASSPRPLPIASYCSQSSPSNPNTPPAQCWERLPRGSDARLHVEFRFVQPGRRVSPILSSIAEQLACAETIHSETTYAGGRSTVHKHCLISAARGD